MKRITAGLIFAVLAACASAPQNPQQAVYQAEQAYTTAASIALIYKQLPPCPQATKLCADPAIVVKIKAADMTAYNLLVQAETAVRTGGSNIEVAVALAQSAIKALTDMTSTLGVK